MRTRLMEALLWVLVWALLLAVIVAVLPDLGFWPGTALIAATGVVSFYLVGRLTRRGRTARHHI